MVLGREIALAIPICFSQWLMFGELLLSAVTKPSWQGQPCRDAGLQLRKQGQQVGTGSLSLLGPFLIRHRGGVVRGEIFMRPYFS